MTLDIVVRVIAPVFVFVAQVSSASGLICKEHHCENIVDSGSLRLEGGRSTRPYANISDGYVAIANGIRTAPIGYVCNTDEKTKQLQGNAICRTLGFEKAFDIPEDNRYGKPPETLQSYKLNCTNEDSPCVLEKTDDCNTENVLSVWCITDYSVRLVTDDKEKFLGRGIFVYYLNFTWYKVSSFAKNQRIFCKIFGFEEGVHYYGNKTKPIPAEANYSFGDKQYTCKNTSCRWESVKRIGDTSIVVNCSGGTAQTILDRINPPPAEQTSGNKTVSPPSTTDSSIPPITNNTVAPDNQIQKTAGRIHSPGNTDHVAIAVGVASLVLTLILSVLLVLFWKRQRKSRYAEVRIEGNEITMDGSQDAENVGSV